MDSCQINAQELSKLVMDRNPMKPAMIDLFEDIASTIVSVVAKRTLLESDSKECDEDEEEDNVEEEETEVIRRFCSSSYNAVGKLLSEWLASGGNPTQLRVRLEPFISETVITVTSWRIGDLLGVEPSNKEIVSDCLDEIMLHLEPRSVSMLEFWVDYRQTLMRDMLYLQYMAERSSIRGPTHLE